MNIAILTLTVKAAAALTANRAVTVAGAVPAAGAACIGVTRTAGATGDLVPVDALGTTMAEAGAAVAVGDALEVDNLGRVITLNTGVKVGRALQAASAAGKVIEVVLIPN
jgi:hypothetical protein